MTDSQFDPRALLEQILNTSKDYVEKGQELAEEKLDIPESGPERERMLDGLKKGALASAVLVGLLGTKGGRNLTGTAIKLGGLAALGTAAFKGYQNWQTTGSVMGEGESPVHDLDSDAAESRGLLLIEAMVAAANADGAVDSQEQQAIKHEILEMHLDGEMAMVLENIVDAPLSAEELAQKVSNKAEASEVYLATRLLIGNDSSAVEKAYLSRLLEALDLAPELVSSLDQQA